MRRKKRGDRKGESNDSPEIPDRGIYIRNPRPPFGVIKRDLKPDLLQTDCDEAGDRYSHEVHRGRCQI